MAESISISSQTASRQEIYSELAPQLTSLVSTEENYVSVLANIAAALKYSLNFHWVGFYLVEGDCLTLGPFQGPVACYRIDIDKGVCGAVVREKKTILAPDVDQFPGHIACSSESKSEIVVPVYDLKGELRAVLDVDSNKLNDFDSIDQGYLEQLAESLRKIRW